MGGGGGGEGEEEGKREIRCDIGIFTTDFDLGELFSFSGGKADL